MARNQVEQKSTGNVDLRYNPMSVDEDYFIADGIDNNGDGRIDENIDNVHDLAIGYVLLIDSETFSIPKPGKIKEFFLLYWPTFISSSLFQANLIIGMLICSFETGAVAYLYYSERLFFFPLTLIGVAIGIVLIPNFLDNLNVLFRRCLGSNETK